MKSVQFKFQIKNICVWSRRPPKKVAAPHSITSLITHLADWKEVPRGGMAELGRTASFLLVEQMIQQLENHLTHQLCPTTALWTWLVARSLSLGENLLMFITTKAQITLIICPLQVHSPDNKLLKLYC